MSEENSWVFIEEPELNMHPGLQNLFINTILTNEVLKNKNNRYFFTTHSNHLLNLCNKYPEDISIFTLSKTIKNKSVVKSEYKNNQSILDLIGVFNSYVIMANCSIWVEGISDRKYLMAYLMAYIKDRKLKEYKEDLDYTFFEYAGSNLLHYFFSDDLESIQELEKKIKALSLSNRIFLIADKDKNETKNKRHKKLKKLEGPYFKYETTGAIEIENTLSSEIIKKILEDVLSIPDNVIQNLETEESEYEGESLGSYLYEKLNGKINKVPAIKEKNGGTLTSDYKRKFSDYVLRNVESGNINWQMISSNKHAEKLTKKVYNFIKMNNELTSN